MDILEAYEKSQPKAQFPSAAQTPEQLLQQRYAPDTGFFIRLVIRLSGRRIQSARQASVVLLVVAGIIMFAALIVFVLASSSGGETALPYEETYLPTQPVQ